MMPEQLMLELFPKKVEIRGTDEWREQTAAEWREWLRNVKGCTEDGAALFDAMRRKLPDAYDRSKAIDVLDGRRKLDGWTIADADILGLFDAGLDYHTVWDRAWAARRGVPKEEVALIDKWGFSHGWLYRRMDGSTVAR